MRIKDFIDEQKIRGVSGAFCAIGSFGMIDGDAAYTVEQTNEITRYIYQNEKVRLCCEFKEEENGVVVRSDYLENVADSDIEINALFSRFCLDGNDYEVYTQYNGWQNESRGRWQPLVTQINSSACGIRTCDGATPMMALHNVYTKKNIVFHLIPNAQWKMTVKKFPRSDKQFVVLETGFENTGMRLKVEKGERIALPAVVFYQAENKVDLDAYKLHQYFNEKYSRRELPILYNSWLYCFDVLDIDALKKQADCAAEMGFEAFMIDAGWFGKGNDWYSSVGDWEENTQGGPRGRLLELSEHIRNKGMIFGLWFEPERAAAESNAVKERPEYFINNTFLDFSKEEAREYIFKVISEQIEKYKIGWLKFDFNATIPFDPSGNAFYRYMQGQKIFVEKLKERYPDIYITNCASGGQRMELGQGMLFDSFWLSDNQGPYEGLRIVKDTLKRMPTGMIERWNVQKYCEGFPAYGKEAQGRMVHCNDATWDFLIGVKDGFSEEFMKGGPLGFSCDINEFSEQYKKRWKEVIERYKAERNFFKNATARILIDSESITAIEYANENLTKCYIQIFSKTIYASDIVVYPIVNERVVYNYNEEDIVGKTISTDGLRIKSLENNTCKAFWLLGKN